MATLQVAPRPNWENPDKIRLTALWDTLGSIFLISVIMKRPYGSVMTEASRIRLPKREMASPQHRKKWTPEAYEFLWSSVARNTLTDGRIDLMAVVDETERPIDVIVSKLAERHVIPKDKVKGLVWLPADAEQRVSRARTAAGIKSRSSEIDMRKCLRCAKNFRSEWKGNRICPRCNSDHY